MSKVFFIPYKGKKLAVKVPDLENWDFDVDQLLMIDETRMMLEIVMFPAIMNRLGLLLAECEEDVLRTELDVKRTKAKLWKESIEGLRKLDEKVTNDSRDAWVRGHAKYFAKSVTHINAIKTRDYMNSIYWAAKDKSEKLDKLAEKVRPDDLVLDGLYEEFHGVKVVFKDNLIK